MSTLAGGIFQVALKSISICPLGQLVIFWRPIIELFLFCIGWWPRRCDQAPATTRGHLDLVLDFWMSAQSNPKFENTGLRLLALTKVSLMGLAGQAAWIQRMILAAAWRHALTDWGVKQRPSDMAGASSGRGTGRWWRRGLFGSNLLLLLIDYSPEAKIWTQVFSALGLAAKA